MPIFEHDGIMFYYEDSGDGLPFVLQHGLGADCSHAGGIFSGRQGVRLVRMDSRGHGRTKPVGDPSRFTFDDFGDDVLALMKHLGTGPFAAGGISMGAGIALNLAIRWPEWIKGLVMVRPAWLEKPFPDNLAPFKILAQYLQEWGAQNGLANFRQSADFYRLKQEKPHVVDMLEEAFLQPGASERSIRYEKLPGDAPNHERSDWKKVMIPTLVIGCHNDTVHPYTYAQTLAEEIPGAELVEVTSKNVDPGQYTIEVQAAILDFLERRLLTKKQD